MTDIKIINNLLYYSIINPVNSNSNLSTDRSLRPCKHDWDIHSEYWLNFFQILVENVPDIESRSKTVIWIGIFVEINMGKWLVVCAVMVVSVLVFKPKNVPPKTKRLLN